MPQQESLCQAFNRISQTVWEEVAENIQLQNDSSETGITANTVIRLLRRFIKLNQSDSIWIDNAKGESKNGGDIDLYIQIKGGKYIRILLQAKVLKKSGTFESLYHLSGSNKIPQWELLQNVENKKWAKTYYLFYSGLPNTNYKGEDCKGTYNQNQLGIVLVDPTHIKNFFDTSIVKRKMRFSDILPYAIPWRTLVCCNTADILSKHLNTYDLDDINVDDDFQPIFTGFSDFIGSYDEPDTSKSFLINKNLKKMNLKPKRRLIINRKDNSNGTKWLILE